MSWNYYQLRLAKLVTSIHPVNLQDFEDFPPFCWLKWREDLWQIPGYSTQDALCIGWIFSLTWNWIFIEVKLNFHWSEIEFSLNWNWIFIELKLNFYWIEIEFYWIEIEFLLKWNWILFNWNWISFNWNWISLNEIEVRSWILLHLACHSQHIILFFRAVQWELVNFFILNAADHELVICLTCGSVGICDFFLLNAATINLYFYLHASQFKLVIFFLLNTARYELIICSFQRRPGVNL